MTTSLIEIELPNFGQMTASTVKFESRGKTLLAKS